MTTQAQRLQGLLFLAGEAVAFKELVNFLGEPDAAVRMYVAEVAESMGDQGLTLVQTDSHVQMVTSPAIAEFIKAFLRDDAANLTAAAAETLTLIAYRGPITSTEIELIRGVDSRHMVRQLVSRGLIRRTSKAQRSMQYEISEEFLAQMGLRRREELPDFEKLSTHTSLQDLVGDAPHGSS